MSKFIILAAIIVSVIAVVAHTKVDPDLPAQHAVDNGSVSPFAVR